MKGFLKFIINGEEKILPLFEKGDRVKVKETLTAAIEAIGTVEKVRHGGLFVEVVWDKEKFESKTGGHVSLGKTWMSDSLELIS